MDRPVLSVCVCTYDGAERIADTIWSLVRQSAPDESYEILIVENGSEESDSLREQIEAFQKGSVSIRLVGEKNLGLSHARNTALRESRGDYLLFIDDDALAGPRLIERYLSAITRHQPDVIGGNVHPIFAHWPAAEIDYRYWARFSLKLFGAEDRWLDDDEYFIGTNMGASRSLLEREGFDPELGRQGGRLAGCEDWFLGEERFRRRFVTGADVFHKVPEERLDIDYLAKRNRDLRDQLSELREKGRPVTVPQRIRSDCESPNPIVAELRLLARKLRYHFVLSRAQRRTRILRESRT
ncbi:MAG: glycosyltransferase family 2 protein [Deltaproteobacteria bacterium]|nr:glycosyltransferase family 2 protein [Deltaproteobacteria bacterium]